MASFSDSSSYCRSEDEALEAAIAISAAEYAAEIKRSKTAPHPRRYTMSIDTLSATSEAALSEYILVASEGLLSLMPGTARRVKPDRLSFDVTGSEERIADTSQIIKIMLESAEVPRQAKKKVTITVPDFINGEVEVPPSAVPSLQGRQSRFKQLVLNEFGIFGDLVDENTIFLVTSADREWFQIFSVWMSELNEEVIEKKLPLFNVEVDVTDIAGDIVGRKGAIIKWLQHSYGVTCGRIRIAPKDGRSLLKVSCVDEDALAIFVDKLHQIIADPVAFQTETRNCQRELIHLYVDVGSIMREAQLTEAGRDFATRVNCSVLVDLVLRIRSFSDGAAIGTYPPPENGVWKVWKKLGFSTTPLEPDRVAIETVSSYIRSSIMQTISKYESNPTKHTIVILPGRSDDEQYRLDMTHSIEAALTSGFKVEVWCWQAIGSGGDGFYEKLRDRFRLRFELLYLNLYRPLLTYSFHKRKRIATYGAKESQFVTDKVSNAKVVLEEKFSDTEEEDELLCPIGMCLMDDAVKTPGNHCFQRAHILDWISKSGTCPLTRNPLRAEDLVPDEALKRRVHSYKLRQGVA